jgi:hypothetical protein
MQAWFIDIFGYSGCGDVDVQIEAEKLGWLCEVFGRQYHFYDQYENGKRCSHCHRRSKPPHQLTSIVLHPLTRHCCNGVLCSIAGGGLLNSLASLQIDNVVCASLSLPAAMQMPECLTASGIVCTYCGKLLLVSQGCSRNNSNSVCSK